MKWVIWMILILSIFLSGCTEDNESQDIPTPDIISSSQPTQSESTQKMPVTPLSPAGVFAFHKL